MIVLIAIKENDSVSGGIERNVVGSPTYTEAEMQRDMTVAEQAGYTCSAFEVEDPAVFRSTLGLPL